MATFPGRKKETFFEYIENFPMKVVRSIFRHNWPNNDLDRSEVVFKNFFLHFHPVKCHKHVLDPFYTLGLGTITMSLFLILVFTGVILMFYYIPTVDRAYDIMKDWQDTTPFAMMFRNMHRWAAQMMVLFVFLHMSRVFYTGSYKGERKFNWVVGISLLVLTLLLSFTGYLLPWDQLAFWAITVGAEIAGYAPNIPGFEYNINRLMLLASTTVGQDALIRFFVLHIAVLPLAASMLIGVHFWRIRKDGGLSRPPDRFRPDPIRVVQRSDTKEVFAPGVQRTYGLMELVRGTNTVVDNGPENYVFSWPNLLRAELMVFVATLVYILILSFFIDAPLEEIANPTKPPNPAKAPWYFLGLQEMVAFDAFWGGVAVPGLIIVGLMLIPYIDRNLKGEGIWFDKSRYLAITIYTIFMTVMGLLIVVGVYFRGANWGWIWPWTENFARH
ncbi:cytochrome b N-terminal domain-containing protein [Simkania negevensis]|uniref:Cytochrome b N-terminal domain-containing protein n=1 Tax=Simkania negevensis TaxID=83561 RepID=A0ABS3AQJ5_9BACT|nr:cytochrome b N-terminal domain-containing protein [Simkania negevensis]